MAPFKKGPDYIDAAWLSKTAEKPCRNLDLFLMSPSAVVRSFVASAGEAELLFTAVPPGLGLRLGIDEDEDGLYDFLEKLRYGTRADDPDSDDDGYDDLAELALGGDPTRYDGWLPDTTDPDVVEVEARSKSDTG